MSKSFTVIKPNDTTAIAVSSCQDSFPHFGNFSTFAEPTAARAALRIFTIDEKMNVHYKMNVLFISFPGGKALMCQKADVI